MNIVRRIWQGLILSICGLVVWQCRQAEPINVRDHLPASYVDADGSHESNQRDTLRNRYPHLKMEGGAITLNDKCPVRKAPLNLRLPVLFVNGQPIGFC